MLTSVILVVMLGTLFAGLITGFLILKLVEWRPLRSAKKAWGRFTGDAGPVETNVVREGLRRLGMHLHILKVADGFTVFAELGQRTALAKGRTLYIVFKDLSNWARGGR